MIFKCGVNYSHHRSCGALINCRPTGYKIRFPKNHAYPKVRIFPHDGSRKHHGAMKRNRSGQRHDPTQRTTGTWQAIDFSLTFNLFHLSSSFLFIFLVFSNWWHWNLPPLFLFLNPRLWWEDKKFYRTGKLTWVSHLPVSGIDLEDQLRMRPNKKIATGGRTWYRCWC